MAWRWALLASLSAAVLFQAAGKCNWQKGINFVGADIVDFAASGTGECCSLCNDNPNCVAVTLRLGRCYLKANATSTESKILHQSAIVRQSGVHQGGRYGYWHRDEYGLPAYVYTCDQTSDAQAARPYTPNWVARAAREHVFQLGNKRMTLIGNNFGAFKMRQDEGGPKWLNHAEPANQHGVQYGGGFGYLLGEDDKVEVSTYYGGGSRPTSREFGIGYARQTVQGPNGVKATHVVAVPPGDDPIVLTEVVLTNEGSTPRNVTWVEVWGSQMVPMQLQVLPFDARDFAEKHYESTFSRSNAGKDTLLTHSRKFIGLSDAERLKLDKRAGLLSVPMPLAEGASFFDEAPPSVFLAAVGPGNVNLGTDAQSFFGRKGPIGGHRPPSHVVFKATGVPEEDAALIARVPITIPAFGNVSLHFVNGYLPESHPSANDLIKRWRSTLVSGNLQSAIVSAWRKQLPNFAMPSRPWLEDEMLWHAYYLQGGVSYDTYFKEYIVDQGMSYRYSQGFQGAARDPLQHMMPLILQDPSTAKSVLRYTLKEIQPNPFGFTKDKPLDIPYSVTGKGVINPLIFRPDDTEFYVLQSVTEYILATKDMSFLQERVHYYNDSTRNHTVLEALQHVMNFSLDVTNLGPHGLVRMLSSDWDDGLQPPESERNISETSLTASLATYVLPRFASVLRLAGDEAGAARALSFAQKNREGLLKHAWNGKYLRRAWFGKAGWVGDIEGEKAGIFSPQHGFAMLGGVFDQDGANGMVDIAIDSLVKKCRNGWPFGFGYQCEAPAQPEAGMWPALDHPLLLGLAHVHQIDLAWEEFERNSMQWQATVKPDIWAGLWTSGDMVSQEGWPGSISYGFPALCMHRHAWPQVSLTQLAGIHFSAQGMLLRPAIPRHAGSYNLSTSIAAIAWNGNDLWNGWYQPPAVKETLAKFVLEADLSRVLKRSLTGASRTLRARASGAEWQAATGTGALKIVVPLSSGGIEFEIHQHDSVLFV